MQAASGDSFGSALGGWEVGMYGIAHHSEGMYGKGRAELGALGGLNLREFLRSAASQRQLRATGCHVGRGWNAL